MADVDWTLLAHKVDDLIGEMHGLRDEFRVQHSILMRLDSGQSAVLQELHAMHLQMARVLDRLERQDTRISALEQK